MAKKTSRNSSLFSSDLNKGIVIGIFIGFLVVIIVGYLVNNTVVDVLNATDVVSY